MRSIIRLLCVLGMTTTALADTVTITQSASAVAAGGSVGFSVAVTPGTDVQKVTLAYQGEATIDQLYGGPYNFTHTFSTPGLNRTVTATVYHASPTPNDVATTTVSVVDLVLTGSTTPTRGTSVNYTVQSVPAGVSLTAADWSYDAGSATRHDPNTDGDDKSSWAGTMVVNGNLQVAVTLLGVTTQITRACSITPRNWTTPITCAQDNESGWGDPPMENVPFGYNRDRDSNDPSYIFVPRNGNDFSPAMSFGYVSSGPCTGWYYISSTTLKCQRETVINRYLKANAPLLDGTTFMQVNGGGVCFTGDFLQAVKNHEYRGTPDTPRSWEGHEGRIEYMMADSPLLDPRKKLEEASAQALNALKQSVNETVTRYEGEISDYALDEGDQCASGPNWGLDPQALGSGSHSVWTGTMWSGDCAHGPTKF